MTVFWRYAMFLRLIVRAIARATVTKTTEGRLGDPERPERKRHEPKTRGRQMKHADDVLRRRVIRPLLISLVQPVQLREHDPEREAREEEQRLLRDREPTPEQPRLAGERFCEEKRRGQAGEVGREEGAPDEPPSALVGAIRAAPVEDRPGAFVDRLDQVALERRAAHRLRMRFNHRHVDRQTQLLPHPRPRTEAAATACSP